MLWLQKLKAPATRKLQVFINQCLRKILKIYWPEVVFNKTLQKRTNEDEIRKRIKI